MSEIIREIKEQLTEKIINIKKIKSLIDQCSDLNEKYDGKTILHYAVIFAAKYGFSSQSSYREVVRYLLEKGSNVSERDNDGKTPLHCAVECAAKYGTEEGFRSFIPLSMASFARVPSDFHNGDIITLLLEKGADINAVDGKSAIGSPLHYAIKEKNEKVIKLLLKEKADVNVKDFFGRTPSQVADEENYKEYQEMVDLVKKEEDNKESKKMLVGKVVIGLVVIGASIAGTMSVDNSKLILGLIVASIAAVTGITISSVFDFKKINENSSVVNSNFSDVNSTRIGQETPIR